MEQQAGIDLAAADAVAGDLPEWCDLGRGGGYPRSAASDRLCAAGAVLYHRRGKDLFKRCGIKTTGTGFEAVRALCVGKGCYHLRHGVDACPAGHRTGNDLVHHGSGRFRDSAGGCFAAGNRSSSGRMQFL